MKYLSVILILIIAFSFFGSLACGTNEAPTPTPAPTPTLTPTPLPTPTPTPLPSPTPTPTPTPSTIPDAPSLLTATARFDNRIDVKWQDNSIDEIGFRIERSRYDIDWTYEQVAVVGSNIVTYSDLGLAVNTIYYYRVRAYNNAGNSVFSNTLTAGTTGLAPTATATPTRAPTTTPVSTISNESSINLNLALTGYEEATGRNLFVIPNFTMQSTVSGPCVTDGTMNVTNGLLVLQGLAGIFESDFNAMLKNINYSGTMKGRVQYDMFSNTLEMWGLFSDNVPNRLEGRFHVVISITALSTPLVYTIPVSTLEITCKDGLKCSCTLTQNVGITSAGVAYSAVTTVKTIRFYIDGDSTGTGPSSYTGAFDGTGIATLYGGVSGDVWLNKGHVYLSYANTQGYVWAYAQMTALSPTIKLIFIGSIFGSGSGTINGSVNSGIMNLTVNPSPPYGTGTGSFKALYTNSSTCSMYAPTPVSTATPIPQGPDLEVKNVTVAWDIANSTYSISYKVCNNGSINAGETTVVIYIDGVLKHSLGLTVLPSGYCTPQFPVGIYSITGTSDKILICIDPNNYVAEAIESNNRVETVFPKPIVTPAPTPAGGGEKACFIATSSSSDPDNDGRITTLRNFRDDFLVNDSLGSGFVNTYYRVSPPIADFISDNPDLKPLVRGGLIPAVTVSTTAISFSLPVKIAITLIILCLTIVLIIFFRKIAIRKLI